MESVGEGVESVVEGWRGVESGGEGWRGAGADRQRVVERRSQEQIAVKEEELTVESLGREKSDHIHFLRFFPKLFVFPAPTPGQESRDSQNPETLRIQILSESKDSRLH